MSAAGKTTGTCSRHRGKPVLSTCVTCGRPLCADCIVRTPVGFKCTDCTGDQAAEAVPRRARRDRHEPDKLSEDNPRRRLVAVAVAVAAVVVLILAGVAGTRLFRSSGQSVQTSLFPAPTSAANGPTDVPVQFDGASGHLLSGDLLTPARGAAGEPAVVIVPDWGAVDRTGMVPSGTLADPLYTDLAQALAARGIASIRYDPAGRGQSTIPQGSTQRFDDVVGDADAALKVIAARAGVDTSRLWVIGDGWGGLAALQLAAQEPKVSRLVLISTPGRPVVETLVDQLRATAVTPADGAAEVQQLRQAARTLAAGGHLPEAASLETALRPILLPDQETYLRALFALDPATIARAVHIPALIVQGGQDPGLSPTDSSLLAGALGPGAKVSVADRAGHTLSIVTETFTAGGTTTIATPNGGMQNIHLGSPTVTISRDDTAVTGIVNWLLGAAG